MSDEPVIFRHLERKDLKSVIDLELSKIRVRLQERGFELELTNDAKEFLIKKGTNLDYGARPLRRALENFVEDPLSEELLQNSFAGKNRIMIDVVRNEEGKMKHLKFEGVFVPSAGAKKEAEAAGAGH